MTSSILDRLSAEIKATPVARSSGKIEGITGGQVTISGLGHAAHIGDRISFQSGDGGEVVSLEQGTATVVPESPNQGLGLGQSVLVEGAMTIRPDQSWLGRIVDPNGMPMDGRPLPKGSVMCAISSDPMNRSEQRGLGVRLASSLTVFDTMLPIVRGQRIGLFAGAGVGKSTLIARLVVGVEADVIVLALVGERGREIREFTAGVLGKEGMRRTVVVAATADRSPLMRRRCAESAVTVAEYFRDQGKHVLFVADSITRYADAHREIALMAGEPDSLRGHPPSMAARVMGLAERTGPGAGTAGDITSIFSVLVAGSDMDEPVSDTLRGVLDGHVVLDREIAERGRFPAIDVSKSLSRALPEAASPSENQIISKARSVLARYERNEMMVRSGLYVPGGDPDLDHAISIWPDLDRFFTERSDNVDDSFRRLSDILAREDPSASAVDQ